MRGKYFGKIYFWDHENEPEPDDWGGEVESAGNIQLLAHSFAEFVAGLRRVEPAFKQEHGTHVLLDRMGEVELPWIFDESNRPSLVD